MITFFGPKIFCHENLHFVKTYITLIRMVRKMMNDVSMVVKWKIGRPWAGHSRPRHFRNQGSSVGMQSKLRPKRLLWKKQVSRYATQQNKNFQTYAISPKFFFMQPKVILMAKLDFRAETKCSKRKPYWGFVTKNLNSMQIMNLRNFGHM